MAKAMGGLLLHPTGEVKGLEEVQVNNWLPNQCQQQTQGLFLEIEDCYMKGWDPPAQEE